MNDCMTQEDAMNMNNEQAVSILIPLRDMMRDQHGCPISDAYFALDKAIEALKQLTQPNTPNTLNALDTISRQDAIDTAKRVLGDHEITRTLQTALRILPSTQPEQTKMIKEIREWINSGNRGSADYFIVDKIEEIINKYE